MTASTIQSLETPRPSSQEPSNGGCFDLAVIGAGSGGMAAARAARTDGKSVVIFEDRYVGGTCVNAGCVPKKLLVHASRLGDSITEAQAFGWSVPKHCFNWERLRDTVDQEVRRLSEHHRKRLHDLGVTIVERRASLEANGSITTTDGSRYEAETIILATGARPRIPDLDGIEHTLVSDDLFHLTRLPKKMALVGGGYIAVEFACLLSKLGVAVTVFETGDQIAKNFDSDIVDALTKALIDQGITIRTGARVAAISKDGNDKSLQLAAGDVHHGFGEVLIAAGRVPNSHALGLEAAGIEMTDRGFIAVDEFGQTSRAGVYAVGDVADPMMLTPVAVREARRSIDAIEHRKPVLPAPQTIPTAMFSSPECASVGLGEDRARDLGLSFNVRRTRFTPLASLVSGNTTKVLMKALVEEGSGRLLGFHFFGPHASEAAQLGALALSARLTERQLHATMPLHPTVAEEVIGLGLPDKPIHQASDGRKTAKAA